MDLERILGKHDLNERYIPNNTESPNFGQVMTLFHIGLGEEIPVNVAQAAVKIAIRDRDRVKSQIETWNGIVREGFGEKTSKMALQAMVGTLAITFGVSSPKRTKERLGELAQRLQETIIEYARAGGDLKTI